MAEGKSHGVLGLEVDSGLPGARPCSPRVGETRRRRAHRPLRHRSNDVAAFWCARQKFAIAAGTSGLMAAVRLAGEQAAREGLSG